MARVTGAGRSSSGSVSAAVLRDTMVKASTSAPRRGFRPPMFRNPVLLLVAAVVGVIVLGLLAIGAFPPSVTPQPTERAIPAERFAPRN
jgi:hypothetical protein